ncbi:MAG: bifunctional phosphopantothenoylcysteine decarboxylase/phosphopantothenate--cysteine ligase CoaBC [Spirochaetales bacterium]|nr:bifunctional phosphopantothenoylcysteine decarboxylase/phosphopantothenate--cysteine ligase CoaBC [Spirochaetales bacterium]
MKDHPTKDIIATISNNLLGKRIIVCITGSVGAVKSSELARLLIRHGAEVIPVMSSAACKIIHPDLIHWATGIKPITEITGEVEHVKYAGNTTTKADMMIIYPATANTLGKIANGIDDTVVTTFATTAIGEGIPLMIIPAMHYPMYQHPFVKENIKKIKSIGIEVSEPTIEEGKAKIPDPVAISERIIEFFCTGKILTGKKILITAGRTVEYIDPIRVVTNNSSGKMGKSIAKKALELGAEVEVVYGLGTEEMPTAATVTPVQTSEQMYAAVEQKIKNNKYDYIFCVAAVGDWIPINESTTKISTHSNKELTIKFRPSPKILDMIGRNKKDSTLIAFRAEHNLSEEALVEDAIKRMEKANSDIIATNDTGKKGSGFMSETNQMIFISKKREIYKTKLESKDEIARQLLLFVTKNK